MEKTYRNVSLIQKNYFDLLCNVNGYSREEYDIAEREDECGFNTYIITVHEQRCDNILQRVFRESND